MRAMVVAMALVLAVSAGAAWNEGETIRQFSLQDQHGRPADVDDGVRLLLVSRDMKGGGFVKEALAEVDQAFLDARRAVYVADISGMPAVVSRLFAVPAMRKRGYRVLLDRDGSATRELATPEGKVAIVTLDRLRVVRVAHATSPREVRDALGENVPPQAEGR